MHVVVVGDRDRAGARLRGPAASGTRPCRRAWRRASRRDPRGCDSARCRRSEPRAPRETRSTESTPRVARAARACPRRPTCRSEKSPRSTEASMEDHATCTNTGSRCSPCRDHRCDLDVEAAHPRGIGRIRFHEWRAALGVTTPAERRVRRAGARAARSRERDEQRREKAAVPRASRRGGVYRAIFLRRRRMRRGRKNAAASNTSWSTVGCRSSIGPSQ